MPRKPKQPAKPRKPATKRAAKKPADKTSTTRGVVQSGAGSKAAVVVNVGETAPKRRRAPRRRAAPRQTIEEAEYIAALNRTMPAVQINPPPASQVPLLSQEQAVGLIQSALALKSPAEISLAQKDVERRNAAARMQEANTMLEKSLADIRSRPEQIDIPAHSTFSFTPPKDVVPMGEPTIDYATIPLEAPPRMQETTNIVSEPASDSIHMNALAAPNKDKMSGPEAGFPKPTLPDPISIPILKPDGDFAFAAETKPPSTPKGNAPRSSRGKIRMNKATGRSEFISKDEPTSPTLGDVLGLDYWTK